MARLLVAGVGMVSPVGCDTARSCAALRAGIARFVELEGVIDGSGNPIHVAAMPPVEGGEAPDRALTAAAVRAAAEALDSAGVDADAEIFVAVVTADEPRPDRPFDIDSFKDALNRQRHSRPRYGVYPLGNAGAASALLDLSRHLAQASRAAGLIVAADSLVGLSSLASLERAGRLKSPTRPRGVIAGEAAAALVVEAADAPRRARSEPYCAIAGLGVAQEPVPVGRDEPCRGEGLTAALDAALADAGWGPHDADSVYCDLNGEEYRAHEWMLATCRTIHPGTLVHPADCIGDVGAASLPLLIGMSAAAFGHGHARFDRAVAWASSDGGARGAVCLEAL